jgi:hypothetical protein
MQFPNQYCTTAILSMLFLCGCNAMPDHFVPASNSSGYREPVTALETAMEQPGRTVIIDMQELGVIKVGNVGIGVSVTRVHVGATGGLMVTVNGGSGNGGSGTHFAFVDDNEIGGCVKALAVMRDSVKGSSVATKDPPTQWKEISFHTKSGLILDLSPHSEFYSTTTARGDMGHMAFGAFVVQFKGAVVFLEAADISRLGQLFETSLPSNSTR